MSNTEQTQRDIASDVASHGAADGADVASIDRDLGVERHILDHERRAGLSAAAVEACWNRIDQLLERRIAALSA